MVGKMILESREERSIGSDRNLLLGVHFVLIHEQVDGLGNFHTPAPVFVGISQMMIYRA